MRFGTGSMAKTKSERDRFEKEAAQLLVECGRLRRENMKLRRQLEAVRKAVAE